jgi:DNA-binding HxlR family transcriptional regulator
MKVKKHYKNTPQSSDNHCIERTCPIEFILEIIGHKWSIQILRELFQGSRRTHELLEALPGISTKTLTLRLRQLQHHDLVKRTVYPEIPPHVEYTLTEKGRELRPVLLALKQVGETWLQQQSCICPLDLSG